jgi:hypothetical protein
MDWIQLIVIVCVFGFAFWGVQTYLSIPQPFKGVVMLILVLVACFWTLHLFGLTGSVPPLRLRH